MKCNFFRNLTPARKKLLIAIFVCFVLALLTGMAVPLLRDDLGYASLSFGETNFDYYDPTVIGNTWNVGQLMSFLVAHYLKWGGRVVPFFFYCLIIKCNSYFFYALQAFVLIGIVFFIYKVVLKLGNKTEDDYVFFVIIFALIHLCSYLFLRGAIYWACASILYVWTLLPMCALFYLLLIRKERKNKYIYPLIFVCALFASINYEGYSIIMIIFTGCLWIFTIVEKQGKKEIIFKSCLLMTVLAAGLFVILAPGNFIRRGEGSMFDNVLKVFGVIHEYTLMTCYYPLIFLILLFINQIKTKNKKCLISIGVSTLLLVVSSLMILTNNAYLKMIFVFLQYCALFVTIIICLHNRYITVVTLSFFAYICFLAFADSGLSHRAFYPIFYLYAALIALAYVPIRGSAKEVKHARIANRAALIAFFACSLTYYSMITVGYYQNKMVANYNENILMHYQDYIDSENKIYLKKNANPYCQTSVMPYDSYDCYLWTHRLYVIPEDVIIVYN